MYRNRRWMEAGRGDRGRARSLSLDPVALLLSQGTNHCRGEAFIKKNRGGSSVDETQTKPQQSFCVEVLLNTLYLLILQRCLAQYRHRALRVNGLSQPNAKKTLHVLPVGAYCFPPAGRRTGAGKKNAHYMYENVDVHMEVWHVAVCFIEITISWHYFAPQAADKSRTAGTRVTDLTAEQAAVISISTYSQPSQHAHSRPAQKRCSSTWYIHVRTRETRWITTARTRTHHTLHQYRQYITPRPSRG